MKHFPRFSCLSLLVILLLECTLTSSLRAQEAGSGIHFRNYSSRQGLSSVTIYDILKDDMGFIWLATEDGLNRFDGTHFKVYRRSLTDSIGLGANHITSLFESKNGKIWIGTNGGGLNFYDRKMDAIFPFIEENKQAIWSAITNISGDHQGFIWVAGFGGLRAIDPNSNKLSSDPHHQIIIQKLEGKVANCFLEDGQHNIWVGTNNGLFLLEKNSTVVQTFFHNPLNSASIAHNNITSLLEDANGQIWAGTDGGLTLIKSDKRSFHHFKHQSANTSTQNAANVSFGLSSNVVFAIATDHKNRIWIGTEEGLDVMDLSNYTIQSFVPDKRNPRSLSSRSIRSIHIDPEGLYWIGTFRAGLDKYDENLSFFNLKEYNAFDPHGLRSPIVTAFAPFLQQIFIGTDGGGLHLFDPKTGLMDLVPMPPVAQINKHDVSILALETTQNNQLWIGTFGAGLFSFNPANKTFQHFQKGDGPNFLNHQDIFCLLEDQRGMLWIGTNGGGVNLLDPKTNTIKKFYYDASKGNKQLLPGNNFIRDFQEDQQGNIWIGTFGSGITVFNPVKNTWKYLQKSNAQLPSDYILDIFEDSKGNIWVGTSGNGLGFLAKNSDKFITINEKSGLPNDIVQNIQEDQAGKIWISTNKGLSCYYPDSKKFRNYSSFEGLQPGAFLPRSGLKTSSGVLYFGGQNGFNFFDPANLKTNPNIPPVVFTDLQIDNKSILPGEKSPLKTSILEAKEISLQYQQGFSISFEALDYTVPEANQYEYKLEGIDKEWTTTGKEHSVYYANLPAGEYTFRVRASNNDGVWNQEGRSIKIIVHPPFWRSGYAYFIYLLLIAGILIYLRQLGIKKLHLRFAIEQERQKAKELIERERKEAEYQHKLDQIKIKFLTNLSHEFRTPISLIMGPVDQLIHQAKEENNLNQLSLIKRNAKRLLNLVNQLLDFRKMEEQELKLLPSPGKLEWLIHDVCDGFQDLARRKKINLSYHTSPSFPSVQFDHHKMERILFNLLSNAFKFTPENGKITVSVNEVEPQFTSLNTTENQNHVFLEISVSDTGIGIPAADQEKIFQSFFQINQSGNILNQGTGIGLAITKEFVQLHNGNITVESEEGKGSTFIIHLALPIAEEKPRYDNNFIASDSDFLSAPPSEGHFLTEETIEPIQVQHSVPDGKVVSDGKDVSDKPSSSSTTILIVEDDDDFRFYLKENLKNTFKIIEAVHGKDGLEKATKFQPDIIVSDVQMPILSGVEMVQKIQLDKKIKSIPIILLTAAHSPNRMLDGLESGAIDYLTKPFDFAVLLAKINNILSLHSSFKDAYSKKITVSLPETAPSSEKEEFLQKALTYVYKNLDNNQLSVESLSAHLCISRASLYNRLQEYMNISPVEFIRSVKLEKAKDMLEKTDKNVTEIAYETGFTNANYFTKVFRSVHQMTPSEYRTHYKNQNK